MAIIIAGLDTIKAMASVTTNYQSAALPLRYQSGRRLPRSNGDLVKTICNTYSIKIILVVLTLPARCCALLNCESFIHVSFVCLYVIHVWHPCFPFNGIKKYLTERTQQRQFGTSQRVLLARNVLPFELNRQLVKYISLVIGTGFS